MIREFLSKRRIVFFPKSWANSITQWICGIHSPSGTLKIVNTANPSKGKSASLDVDIDAVWERLRERIESLRKEDAGQKLRDSKDETFGDKIIGGGGHGNLTHEDITDWDDATSTFVVTSSKDQTVNGNKTFLQPIFTAFCKGINFDASGSNSFRIRTGNPSAGLALLLNNTWSGQNTIWNAKEDGSFVIGNNVSNSLTCGSVPNVSTSSTSSKVIATCGWVSTLFSPKNHSHGDTYATKDHTHSGYASTNHVHSEYATSSSLSNLSTSVSSLSEVVSNINDSYVSETSLSNTLKSYSNTQTIASTYAKKTELKEANDAIDIIVSDLYDDSGTINFVDISSNQTITGGKTFNSNVKINPNGDANISFRVEDSTYKRRGYFGQGDIWLDKDEQDSSISFRTLSGQLVGLIRMIRTGSDNGVLELRGFSSNKVRLYHTPTDTESTSEKAIPTMGWVNDKFIRSPTDKTLYTGTKDRITDIEWSGSVLRYRVTRETYYKGLLEQSTTDQGWTTIDTPNLIVWS